MVQGCLYGADAALLYAFPGFVQGEVLLKASCVWIGRPAATALLLCFETGQLNAMPIIHALVTNWGCTLHSTNSNVGNLHVCFFVNCAECAGVISKLKDGHASDRFMFLYVNGRFVEQTPIHRHIANLYATSSISGCQGQVEPDR